MLKDTLMEMSKKRSLITFLWGVRKRSWERKTAVRETDRWTDTRTHLIIGRTNKQSDRKVEDMLLT